MDATRSKTEDDGWCCFGAVDQGVTDVMGRHLVTNPSPFSMGNHGPEWFLEGLSLLGGAPLISLQKEGIRKRIYRTSNGAKAGLFDSIEMINNRAPGISSASVPRPSRRLHVAAPRHPRYLGSSNSIRRSNEEGPHAAF